jgi:hypothetical protein
LDPTDTTPPNHTPEAPQASGGRPFARSDAIIAAVLALAAFVAYWYVGPQETAYSYQVSQANNILHGHLDLRPEHTRNLGVLEQVLYDGERFCLPEGGDNARLEAIVEYADAVAAGVPAAEARDQVVSDDCKIYMQHAVGPALIVLPGVAVWGLDLNQALVSAVFGAMTAVVVFAIARSLTPNRATQIGLSVLVLFGTIFWWVAANGGVWMFAHTTAVFFTFCAIYFTLVKRNPLMAGVCLGAAFMCRPTVLMSGLFFVVAFADLWWRAHQEDRNVLGRIDWTVAMKFAAGIAPFMALTLLLNYLRYDSPFESGYNYVESSHQVYLRHLYNEGSFDLSYIQRHPPVIFGGMPLFQASAPYVLPTWFGIATWVTTPAFLYAFFPNIKHNRPLVIAGAILLALACLFMIGRAFSTAWDIGLSDVTPFMSFHLLPFWTMTAVAVVAAIRARDRLTVACWAAIIPTALLIFNFAFVGYAQFGYRYALDFMPFLWLLTARAIGDEIKWHHWLLISIGVGVSLWGVLWIYHFQPNGSFGIEEWVRF